MGEAKNRGTFEERKDQAEGEVKVAYQDSDDLPPEQRAKRKKMGLLLASLLTTAAIASAPKSED